MGVFWQVFRYISNLRRPDSNNQQVRRRINPAPRTPDTEPAEGALKGTEILGEDAGLMDPPATSRRPTKHTLAKGILGAWGARGAGSQESGR